MSPDGAYWWDGKTWQPMPALGSPVEAPPAVEEAPPLWVRQATPSATRSMVMLASVVAIVLMIGAAGVWGWQQYVASQTPSGSNSLSLAKSESASPEPSPGAAPGAVQQTLTAQLGGEYCQVIHTGDVSCWKGSFTNTGPAIGRLAMIFVNGGPYTDWTANHPNSRLSEAFTSANCQLEILQSRIVCGPVPPKGQVGVYLQGVVATPGTFRYAVKFADISSGAPVYVNQRLDGSHEVVTWSERAT